MKKKFNQQFTSTVVFCTYTIILFSLITSQFFGVARPAFALSVPVSTVGDSTSAFMDTKGTTASFSFTPNVTDNEGNILNAVTVETSTPKQIITGGRPLITTPVPHPVQIQKREQFKIPTWESVQTLEDILPISIPSSYNSLATLARIQSP